MKTFASYIKTIYICKHKHTPQAKVTKFLKKNTMEKMINAIAAQANELMKSEVVKDMLRNCKTEQEKCEKLAMAAIYALCKVN